MESDLIINLSFYLKWLKNNSIDLDNVFKYEKSLTYFSKS